MANVIINRTPDSPDKGNAQVDGTTVHTDVASAGRAEQRAQMEALNRIEAQTVPGARSRLPKERMLDATEIAAKDPDHHYRFVNVKDNNKAVSRIEEGYSKVPQEEGGRSLGDELTLMKIPRRKVEERREREVRTNEARMTAHVTEVSQIAESVAKVLRDQHGIRVDTSRIFINEG